MTDRSADQLWFYRAALVRVIDADTLAILVDVGFGARYEAAIRIAGIDAPELGTPEGEAARLFLLRLLDLADAGRWPLLVRTQKTAAGTDVRSFARYVGDVTIASAASMGGGPLDVADALVLAGMARRVGARAPRSNGKEG